MLFVHVYDFFLERFRILLIHMQINHVAHGHNYIMRHGIQYSYDQMERNVPNKLVHYSAHSNIRAFGYLVLTESKNHNVYPLKI